MKKWLFFHSSIYSALFFYENTICKIKMVALLLYLHFSFFCFGKPELPPATCTCMLWPVEGAISYFGNFLSVFLPEVCLSVCVVLCACGKTGTCAEILSLNRYSTRVFVCMRAHVTNLNCTLCLHSWKQDIYFFYLSAIINSEPKKHQPTIFGFVHSTLDFLPVSCLPVS